MTTSDPAPAFTVALRRRARTLVAVPNGELDIASAPLLIAALREAPDDVERLVLDLRDLTFIDSSGLRLLVSEHDRAREGGYALAIVGGAPEVDRLLRLTRLDEALPLIDADAAGL